MLVWIDEFEPLLMQVLMIETRERFAIHLRDSGLPTATRPQLLMW